MPAGYGFFLSINTKTTSNILSVTPLWCQIASNLFIFDNTVRHRILINENDFHFRNILISLFFAYKSTELIIYMSWKFFKPILSGRITYNIDKFSGETNLPLSNSEGILYLTLSHPAFVLRIILQHNENWSFGVEWPLKINILLLKAVSNCFRAKMRVKNESMAFI